MTKQDTYEWTQELPRSGLLRNLLLMGIDWEGATIAVYTDCTVDFFKGIQVNIVSRYEKTPRPENRVNIYWPKTVLKFED